MHACNRALHTCSSARWMYSGLSPSSSSDTAAAASPSPSAPAVSTATVAAPSACAILTNGTEPSNPCNGAWSASMDGLTTAAPVAADVPPTGPLRQPPLASFVHPAASAGVDAASLRHGSLPSSPLACECLLAAAAGGVALLLLLPDDADDVADAAAAAAAKQRGNLVAIRFACFGNRLPGFVIQRVNNTNVRSGLRALYCSSGLRLLGFHLRKRCGKASHAAVRATFRVRGGTPNEIFRPARYRQFPSIGVAPDCPALRCAAHVHLHSTHTLVLLGVL